MAKQVFYKSKITGLVITEKEMESRIGDHWLSTGRSDLEKYWIRIVS